jgi:hypothetical protein
MEGDQVAINLSTFGKPVKRFRVSNPLDRRGPSKPAFYNSIHPGLDIVDGMHYWLAR